MAHQGSLLPAAGQQRVLRVGVFQVQQGGQALTDDNIPIDQGRHLAARVQCHELRGLVLICSTIGLVRYPSTSKDPTVCSKAMCQWPRDAAELPHVRVGTWPMKSKRQRCSLLSPLRSVRPGDRWQDMLSHAEQCWQLGADPLLVACWSATLYSPFRYASSLCRMMCRYADRALEISMVDIDVAHSGTGHGMHDDVRY